MREISKRCNGIISVTMDEAEYILFKQMHPDIYIRKLKSYKGVYRALLPKNFIGTI